MKTSAKKNSATSQMFCGVCTKKAAVGTIMDGCRNLHSTALGAKDPGATQTRKSLDSQRPCVYSWEKFKKLHETKLQVSSERKSCIETIVETCGLENKRFLREKLESALEELVTNAFYHAYRNKDGSEKYTRRETVSLESREALTIRYQAAENGIYLSVTDHAGTLTFEDVARSLYRCYSTETQIEAKEGGAGLGTYMIFDAVTHLKIEVMKGKSTTVSCWIADVRSYDPEHFSFNFFEWEKKHDTK